MREPLLRIGIHPLDVGFWNRITPSGGQGFLEYGILLGVDLDFHLTGAIDDVAGRGVLRPDLMPPAARSPMRRKDINPDERPPPDNGSASPRSLEKLVPVPDPYLNRRASRTQRSMMPPSVTKSSSMD